MFSGVSRRPSALTALALCHIQAGTGHRSRTAAVAASAGQCRYLQPSSPGLGLLSLLGLALLSEISMAHSSLPYPSFSFRWCRNPFLFIMESPGPPLPRLWHSLTSTQPSLRPRQTPQGMRASQTLTAHPFSTCLMLSVWKFLRRELSLWK